MSLPSDPFVDFGKLCVGSCWSHDGFLFFLFVFLMRKIIFNHILFFSLGDVSATIDFILNVGENFFDK